MAAAGSVPAAAITVSDAWARPTPPSSTVAAAYLTIVNHGIKPDRLTGVSTPAAARAALHRTVSQNGMMAMEAVPALALAPGGRIEVKPGGLHIMLFGLRKPLASGDEFPLALQFDGAGTVTVTVKVGAPGAPH
jgi:copper(I)-binding protein